MKTAFIKTLTEEIEKNPNIIVLAGDLGFSVFDEFKEKYPDNFFNMGISEQNMIGVAAGLSLIGKKVFVYSIIPFVTFRCLEQIRNDLCYQDLDVVVVGVGSGVSYGSSGFSHQAIDDIGALKSIPGITILSPSDPLEVKCLVKDSFSYNHPIYLRLGKNSEKIVNKNSLNLKIKEINYIFKGEKIALITYGNIIEEVYEVYLKLLKKGYTPSLISIPTIKPLNLTEIKKIYEKHEKIIVIEEHNRIGGLGESIFPLNEKNVSFFHFAIKDEFIKKVGSSKYLRKMIGLDSLTLFEKINKILEK
jgi:transketolase